MATKYSASGGYEEYDELHHDMKNRMTSYLYLSELNQFCPPSSSDDLCHLFVFFLLLGGGDSLAAILASLVARGLTGFLNPRS